MGGRVLDEARLPRRFDFQRTRARDRHEPKRRRAFEAQSSPRNDYPDWRGENEPPGMPGARPLKPKRHGLKRIGNVEERMASRDRLIGSGHSVSGRITQFLAFLAWARGVSRAPRGGISVGIDEKSPELLATKMPEERDKLFDTSFRGATLSIVI